MIDQLYENEPMTQLDKALFAFAAYDAGPGRVAQLRREAARRGFDPNEGFHNVEYIAEEKIGRETVTYVSNIFSTASPIARSKMNSKSGRRRGKRSKAGPNRRNFGTRRLPHRSGNAIALPVPHDGEVRHWPTAGVLRERNTRVNLRALPHWAA